MPQAKRKSYGITITLVLGGLILFGLILEEMNRRSRPERQHWMLAPGHGVTVTLDKPSHLLRELELTDGSLELPVRWLGLLPTPAYLIANATLQYFATELLIDPLGSVQLGYRLDAQNQRVWYAIATTKNSQVALGNLARLMTSKKNQNAGEREHVAQLEAGRFAGQMMLWKTGGNQLAVVIGQSVEAAAQVLDEIKSGAFQSGPALRYKFSRPAAAPGSKALVESLELDLNFAEQRMVLEGRVHGRSFPEASAIDRQRVRLALRGGDGVQPVWVVEEPGGEWCQKGLNPMWQKLLKVQKGCDGHAPKGWYIYASPALFERLDLPWHQLIVSLDPQGEGALVKGQAQWSHSPRFFPVFEKLRSVYKGEGRPGNMPSSTEPTRRD